MSDSLNNPGLAQKLRAMVRPKNTQAASSASQKASPEPTPYGFPPGRNLFSTLPNAESSEHDLEQPLAPLSQDPPQSVKRPRSFHELGKSPPASHQATQRNGPHASSLPGNLVLEGRENEPADSGFHEWLCPDHRISEAIWVKATQDHPQSVVIEMHLSEQNAFLMALDAPPAAKPMNSIQTDLLIEDPFAPSSSQKTTFSASLTKEAAVLLHRSVLVEKHSSSGRPCTTNEAFASIEIAIEGINRQFGIYPGRATMEMHKNLHLTQFHLRAAREDDIATHRDISAMTP